MVRVEPEILRLVLVAASKVATTLLAASLSTMEPVPRWMVSLKVITILAPMAMAVAPSVGLKLVTVGAAVSAAKFEVCKVTSENFRNSIPLRMSEPSLLDTTDEVWVELFHLME